MCPRKSFATNLYWTLGPGPGECEGLSLRGKCANLWMGFVPHPPPSHPGARDVWTPLTPPSSQGRAPMVGEVRSRRSRCRGRTTESGRARRTNLPITILSTTPVAALPGSGPAGPFLLR